MRCIWRRLIHTSAFLQLSLWCFTMKLHYLLFNNICTRIAFWYEGTKAQLYWMTLLLSSILSSPSLNLSWLKSFLLLLLLQWQTLLLKMCSNKTEQSKLTEIFQYAFCLSFSQHKGLNTSNYYLVLLKNTTWFMGILPTSNVVMHESLYQYRWWRQWCYSGDLSLFWNFSLYFAFSFVRGSSKATFVLKLHCYKTCIVMTTNTYISMWSIVFWHFDFFVNTLMPLLCGITKSERERPLYRRVG